MKNFMVVQAYFNEKCSLPFWAVFYFSSFTENTVLRHFSFPITVPAYAIS